MKQSLLFVALILVISAGCRRSTFKNSDSDQPANQGGPLEVRAGGGPGVMGVHGATDRLQLNNALEQIRIFIDASSVDGNMPSVQTTYEVLKKEAPKYAKYIDDKLIVLNPAKTRDEVWAWAVLPQGNYSVLTSSGIQPMTQQELNQRLGK
ncbi:MAG TPA: hypothetical protein VKD71_14150 [Gemmataceae bacterium]|nr:hypothetical protein [Gemmataceae bacterium]